MSGANERQEQKRRNSWIAAMGLFDRQASQESTPSQEAVMHQRNSQRSVNIAPSFIRAVSNDEAHAGSVQVKLNSLLGSSSFNLSLGFGVAVDLCMTCMTIDARASGNTLPGWVHIVGIICLSTYTMEFLASIYCRGYRVLTEALGFVDFCVLVAGYLELILAGSGISLDSMGILRICRIMRLVRLAKLLRRFKMLRELRKLLMMAASCCKTLCWSFVFCFLLMTAWAMATVEFVNPVVQDLSARGVLDDCKNCQNVTDTVMKANLMLFSTVVAGDSWGSLAVPVILEAPWTAFIFMGALLTIVFGVLNLVVAVVVDTAAEQRLKDINELAQELEDDEDSDLKFLADLFVQIDENDDAQLSLDELIRGAQRLPEFRSRLRVMDIDERDLEQLFSMLDVSSTGFIDRDEFMSALSRWTTESKSASRFVKYNVQKALDESREIKGLVTQISKKLNKLSLKMQDLVQGKSPHSAAEKKSTLLQANREFASESSMDFAAESLDITTSDRFLQWKRQAAAEIEQSEMLRQGYDMEHIEKLLHEAFLRAEQTLQGMADFDEPSCEIAEQVPRQEFVPSIPASVCTELLLPKSQCVVRLSHSKWSSETSPSEGASDAATNEMI
eukprot:TRINITY_DN42401_c0_g1_i1.p1 TRINITY_DN42401_c0_g1~~TRINITY_DN42401_c0_g1_i1.p1  ORF type:complete len:616 (-),score=98.26 TRINITY_DN42401_c0_g1_i1:160-2007(-)